MSRVYGCNIYLQIDTSAAKLTIASRKFVTPEGSYQIQEAYGINSNRCDSGSVNGEEDDNKECVICLTERKNCLAQPCKHVSMCRDCAF